MPTQLERATETRTKLLEATLQSVLDVGYANTTTRRVAELAGVSQGAQSHHFPHRVDLVAAAVEHLAEQRTAAFQDVATDLPEEPIDRLSAILDLLWADLSSWAFTVFVKLWIAAADDLELYERLVPVEDRLARAIGAAVQALGSQAVELPAAFPQLTLATLRGLALTERFEPRGRPLRDPWPAVKQALMAAATVRGTEPATRD